MQFWDTIINTALLGTDKKQLPAAELPAALQEIAELVAAQPGIDREEQFLHLASAAFNYRQSGAMPLQKEITGMPVSAAETLPYCSTLALQALKDILEEDNNTFLTFWLQHCTHARRLVPPDMIPLFLDKAAQHKPMRTLVTQVCGRRGEWLSRFNPRWQFMADTSQEDLWQTGTAEQRKTLLKQLRQQEPAKARELLAQSWAQENANSKADLLKQLTGTVTAGDQEWLESLLAEKSAKVKEEALNLLKQLPGSLVVKQYWQLLQQAITLKKEKALLGMVSKTSLQVASPTATDDSIFKTGIEKLSNNKEFTDEEFIVYQLIKYIPPAYWETHFATTPENILGYFQKEKEHKKYLPALVNAVLQFNDARWAISFMQHSAVFYIDIIPLLPQEQQDYYSLRFFEQYPDSIIRYARERQGGWSAELAKAILKHAAKSPYQYNRSFYNETVHRMPAAIVTELDKYSPPEEHLRASWAGMSEHITKLAAIKQQTITAFNQ